MRYEFGFKSFHEVSNLRQLPAVWDRPGKKLEKIYENILKHDIRIIYKFKIQ